ncbi:hypothetical protein ACIBAI_17380 [Streptomyces sp. NPDC051041]|uniref:hypothetical protein n=1 Tax=Streptomyces sp. NPDC051041 TaxID=3365640 RepID=UPI00378D2A9A
MEQAASDLEENRREQQELIRRLETLREEEALLKGILELAEHTSAAPERARDGEPAGPARTPPGAVTPPAPAQRSGTATGKRRGAKARRPAAGRRPLLRDLLLGLLAGHEEPCSAAELREELLRAHPDRMPTPQVVRNTLEGLVAKGLIRRHKQKRSVLYTVVAPDGRDGTGDDTAAAHGTG